MKETKSEKRTRKIKKAQSENYSGCVSSGIEPPRVYQNTERTPKRMQETNNQRRRKQDKKRRLKRSVRNAIIAFASVIVLIAGSITLFATVFCKIESIQISGSGIYSEQEILNVSTIDVGDNLFLIDSAKVNEILTQNLPYIYKVNVKKIIPKTIRLEITDASAAYSIRIDEKSYILLDDNFKVLEESANEVPAGAISISDAALLSGEAGFQIQFEDEQTAVCLKQLSAAVRAVGTEEFTGISSKGANDNSIIYQGRIAFELGSCDNLENKIYSGLAVCEKLNETTPGAKGRINLSNGKQYYFTPEQAVK